DGFRSAAGDVGFMDADRVVCDAGLPGRRAGPGRTAAARSYMGMAVFSPCTAGGHLPCRTAVADTRKSCLLGCSVVRRRAVHHGLRHRSGILGGTPGWSADNSGDGLPWEGVRTRDHVAVLAAHARSHDWADRLDR